MEKRGFAFIFVLAFFVIGFVRCVDAVAMTTASRTSCVAPCGVFFDAVNTTTPDVWNSGVVQPPATITVKKATSQPINIAGIFVTHVTEGTAVGTGTLSFKKATNTFTWAAPSDSTGREFSWPKDSSDNWIAAAELGVISADGKSFIAVRGIFAQLPATDKSDTIGIAADLVPDYASYNYEWNFGDNPNAKWATDGKSKNKATGYVAAHVYENPGTYTVGLNVTKPDGTKYYYSQDINVQPASGGNWKIYYVSSSDPARSDSNPGTSPSAPLASFSTAMGKITGQNTTILFKRGDSWTTGTTATISAVGPGIIGAYYNSDGSDDATKAKPIIQFSGSNSPLFFIGAGANDWRLMDLDLRGPNIFGSKTSAFRIGGGPSPTNRFLALHISAQYFGGFVTTLWGNNDNQETFIVDSSFTNNGGMYLAGYNLVVLGLTCPGLTDSEHVLRVWHARKSLIAHNILLDPMPTKLALKFQNAEDVGAYDNHHFPPVAKYNIIADNKLRGTGYTMSYAPQDAQSFEILEDAIIERNEFLFDKGEVLGVLISASHVTVRNNIFNMNGEPWKNPQAIRVVLEYELGIPAGLPSSDIRIIGNTAGHATADTQSHFCHISSDVTKILLRNNLAVWTYGSSNDFQGLVIADTGFNLAELDSDYNLWFAPIGSFAWLGYTSYTLANWKAQGKDNHSMMVNPLLVNVTTGDFHLQLSSPARDNGTNVPVWEDFEGTSRPQGLGFDIGAYEFQPELPEPTANIYTPPNTMKIAPYTALFSGADSNASNGAEIIKWNWDFGDANSADSRYDEGMIVAHRFDNAGAYTVRLNVTDSLGATSSTTLPVNVVAFSGVTYYVSNSTGNDSWAGTQAQPFKTLQKAFSVSTSAGNPIKILLKRGDAWSVTQDIYPPKPSIVADYGSGAKPLVIFSGSMEFLISWWGSDYQSAVRLENLHIVSQTGQRAHLGPSLSGSVIRNCDLEKIEITEVQSDISGLVIEDNTIADSLRHCIYTAPNNDLIIRRNNFRNCGQHMFLDHVLYLHGPDEYAPYFETFSKNWLIQDNYAVAAPESGNLYNTCCSVKNVVYKNNTAIGVAGSSPGYQLGMSFVETDNLHVLNNFVKSVSAGINLEHDDRNVTLANNIVVGGINVADGIDGLGIYNNLIKTNSLANGINIDSPYQNVKIHNNIVEGSIASGAGITTSNNLPYSSSLFINSNPQLPPDFKLNSTSPAIDNGTPVPVFDDYAGNPRPDAISGKWDIGAYEFGSEGQPPQGTCRITGARWEIV
ncbi:MAG: choice-of-anchor Q domain-containing protein [archaeon]